MCLEAASWIIHDYVTLESLPHTRFADLVTVGIAIVISLMSLPTNIGKLALASTGSVLAFCFLAFTLVYYGVVEWSKWPQPHPSYYPNSTNHSHISNSSIPWFPVQRPGSDDSSGSEIIATGLALPIQYFMPLVAKYKFLTCIVASQSAKALIA